MEPKFTSRGGHRNAGDADYTANMDELSVSDAFLTDLSRGVDPANGSDELAALLLGLRDEVEAPMPAAPDPADFPELFGEDFGGNAVSKSEAVTEENPAVVSLDQRRAKRGRHSHAAATTGKGKSFRTNPWLAGLVGAAAATVMVAGTGAALYHSSPGGPSESVFGERTNSVEFASALDEIDSKTESGDIAGARLLIDELRDSLNQDRTERAKQSEDDGEAQVVKAPSTVTVTHDPKPEEKPQPAKEEKPATVTVTPEPVTQTVTVTETAPSSGGNRGEASSSARSTSTTPTIPTTTKQLGAPQQAEQSSQ